MNSDTTFTYYSTGPEDTIRLAQALARLIKGPALIELRGDVGSGKTTLVKALLAAWGYRGEVTSPTYTLSQEYALPDGRQVAHFDFYRLNGHDIASDELEEISSSSNTVVLAEWPDHGQLRWPRLPMVVEMRYGQKSDQRSIEITSTSALTKDLKAELQS